MSGVSDMCYEEAKKWRGRRILMVISGFLFCAPWAAAEVVEQSVYRRVDEHGVVSFTDFPVPGGERLHMEPVPAGPSPADASQRLIDQQLAVAKALEDSRLARQAAQTQRLAALAASRPQTIYYEVPRQTSYAGGYYRYRNPRYGHHPGRPGYRPGRPHHPVTPPHRPGNPGRPTAGGEGGRRISAPMWMGNR